MRRLLPVLLALVLAGCTSPQRKAEKQITKISPFCEAMGLEPGTKAWSDCVIQVYSAKEK